VPSASATINPGNKLRDLADHGVDLLRLIEDRDDDLEASSHPQFWHDAGGAPKDGDQKFR
jgi:hypothetical protein